MITVEHCQLMARYNRWMNGKLYACCDGVDDAERKRDRGAFFGSIHATLDHILYGDLAFMSRFTGDPPEAPELGVTQYEDFGELRRVREALDARIEDWAATVTDGWLREILTFVSKVDGAEKTYPHWVLVTHMFNHETHHRGQVTTLLSQMGIDIGTTDITFMPPPQA